MFRKLTILHRRSVSVFLLLVYTSQIILPTTAFALTSGPTQPEYSSFEPVATTNMVNPMTGDFNYNLPLINVPGPNGGGYAMSLSYHSGVSMEEDASWVGYGWTLNPGAINRSKKGVPDDYKGADIVSRNHSKSNTSITAGPSAGVDVMTFFSLDAARAIRYNNYKGYAAINSLSVGIADGLVSIGYNNASDVGSSYSVNINPAALLERGAKKKRREQKKALKDNIKTLDKDKEKKAINDKEAEIQKLDKADSKLSAKQSALNSIGSSFIGYMTEDPQYPVSVSEFTGYSVNVAVSVGFTATPLDIPFRLGVSGNVTSQDPNNDPGNRAYGALYYSDANDDAIKDYSVEKEAAFNKRDLFMPIPFSAEDDFSVTGEGVGGTFKLKNKNIPVFAPPKQTSHTDIGNINGDLQLGVDIGGGVALGGGSQDLMVEGNGVSFVAGNSSSLKPYFAFSGDKSGNLRRTNSDKPNNVAISGWSYDATMMYKNNLNSNDTPDDRSAFIGYTTNKEMALYPKAAYQKRAEINSLVTRGFAGNYNYEDLIGELSTVNEDGNRYVYGLPVYTKEEVSETFYRPEGGGGSCVPLNKVVYYAADNLASGNDSKSPYASTYLLTEITNSDYIDRTFDGPSNDDFGGWTKFSYVKEYGTGIPKGWYNWRMPYNGLTYEKGTLSDVRDDAATYTRGEKEIYYTKEIETRTHKAIFILNDPATEPRYDGYAALGEGVGVRSDKTAKDGLNTLRYLKRIELYAKDPSDPTKTIGKPIKTVNFEYYPATNSLCKNLPNGVNITGGTAGKLTLKRVWFEYQGISQSTISPYEFIYENKKLASSPSDVGNYFRSNGAVNTNYPNIVTELNATKFENPDYNANATDAWGNLGYKSSLRNQVMQPWVYQGNRDVSEKYDPGAWNLKVIKLPSGGQILIQYEEKDYTDVQNLPVNTLVSLADIEENKNPSNLSYKINLVDVGIAPSASPTVQEIQAIDDYAKYLRDYFNEATMTSLPSKKVYFKYLFNLMRNSTDIPQVSSCGSEYITGYCKVVAVQHNSDHTISISLEQKESIPCPLYACRDFYLNNRALQNINTSCYNPDNVDAGDSPENLVTNMVSNLTQNFKAASREVGQKINPVYSYLKLPLPPSRSKYGGGIRVKRIMMYDAGLTPDEETLYGTEYLYIKEDGTSSGVTTNEPVKEENAFVYSLEKRMPQDLAQKLLSGDDKDEFEGPFGESLLPGPSIIYSRVVTKGIYSGTTAPGFTVNEYYTVKDYPSYKIDYSQVSERNPYMPDINAILVNLSFKYQVAAQNYTFITNDMHGKPKRTSRYGGNYPLDPKTFDENSFKLAYREAFDYFQPGQKIPVLNANGLVDNTSSLGVEEQVTIESKKVEDVSDNLGFNVNTSVGYLVIAVLPQLWLSGNYSHSERKLKSTVASKVIHYQSFLKGTSYYKDGLSYRVENRLFDRHTGDPIATVTTDEYNDVLINGSKQIGTYTNYTVPAHYVYPSFGLKSNNEGLVRNETVSGTSFTTAAVSNYKEGDLLSIEGVMCYVTAVNPSTGLVTFSIVGTSTFPTSATKIVKIVNSANSNRLRLPAGNITCYGNDVMDGVATGVAYSPLASSIPNVAAASATVYSDYWPMMGSYEKEFYGITNETNPYLTGERGKWRQWGSYTFKANTTLSAEWSKMSNNSGCFPYTKFDYLTLFNNSSTDWKQENQVFEYSPNGEILEEQNQVGIISAAKFAHKENVPAIIAQNARFSNILFTSFEDKTHASIIADKTCAHTGNNSVAIAAGQVLDPALTSYVVANTQVVSKGLILQYWAKSKSGANQALGLTVKKNDASSQLITFTQSLKNMLRVGEWTLFETYISFPQGALSSSTPIRVELNNSATETIYIDDYKLLPTNAEATCYVYDNTSLRLLATFDDRHFAMIYQYDAEGKLVRKLVETERGVKTISETQYNTPSISR